ncbi:hypothetical protein B0J12DRAFT_766223 [Macrophomina phaseolina]|uniref:ParB/Sulfiredoxin domain-containing protein n=1 Tax=Macrophomina phaseolina TaxID=35725 RepID=A0ABQ8FXW7_9PEZI|nr:hypothetical protein B0J12DRAFT_766223 [Macrophomina phaseolina]
MAHTPLEELYLEERRAHFHGSAKVDLHSISMNYGQETNPDTVKRLIKIFQTQGCARLDPANHVPVLVEQSVLDQALRDANASPSDLLQQFATNLPHINFPPEYKLTCVHGHHRLLAAEAYLLPEERWWCVDLYTSDISESTRERISDAYSNFGDCSDGEKFLQICRYQDREDEEAKLRWTSRLSPNKQEILQKIQRTEWLFQALAKLTPFRGLWADFYLGQFRNILTWKCREEISRYLGEIYVVWSRITSDAPSAVELIDSHTVRQLQGRVPKYSTQDQDAVRALFENGEAFPKVAEDSQRTIILRNIFSLDTIVVSFKTFFEDVKCLEQVALTLRDLSTPGRDDSLEMSFRRIYSGSGRIPIQVAENDFREVSVGPSAAARLGYRQICLCLLRNFPQISPEHSATNKKASKRQKRVSRTATSKTNLDIHHKLANLASQIGFNSPQIQNFLKADTDSKAIRAVLYSIRPREQYAVNPAELETAVLRMKQELGIFKPKPMAVLLPEIATEAAGEPVDLRYGMPSEISQTVDRQHLYLPTLYANREYQTRREITSFGAKRFMFFNFFGRDVEVPLSAKQQSFFPENELQRTENRRYERHCSLGVPMRYQTSPKAFQDALIPTQDVERRASPVQNPDISVDDPEAGTPSLGPNLGKYQVEDYLSVIGRVPHPSGTAGPEEDISDGLERLSQDCRRNGKMAFWKLETNTFILLDDHDDIIKRFIEALGKGEVVEVGARQGFVLIVNDKIVHDSSTDVLASARTTPGLDFPGIIFLIDAPCDQELNPWQKAASFGSFQKAIHLLNGGNLIQSRKRKISDMYTSSSIYSEDGEGRD